MAADDSQKQKAVAHEVMHRRKAALRAMAKLDVERSSLIEEIMREDEDILSALKER